MVVVVVVGAVPAIAVALAARPGCQQPVARRIPGLARQTVGGPEAGLLAHLVQPQQAHPQPHPVVAGVPPVASRLRTRTAEPAVTAQRAEVAEEEASVEAEVAGLVLMPVVAVVVDPVFTPLRPGPMQALWRL